MRASLPRVGNARSIQVGKIAVDLANSGAGPIFRHKERDLVSLVEVVEIHALAPDP